MANAENKKCLYSEPLGHLSKGSVSEPAPSKFHEEVRSAAPSRKEKSTSAGSSTEAYKNYNVTHSNEPTSRHGANSQQRANLPPVSIVGTSVGESSLCPTSAKAQKDIRSEQEQSFGDKAQARMTRLSPADTVAKQQNPDASSHNGSNTPSLQNPIREVDAGSRELKSQQSNSRSEYLRKGRDEPVTAINDEHKTRSRDGQGLFREVRGEGERSTREPANHNTAPYKSGPGAKATGSISKGEVDRVHTKGSGDAQQSVGAAKDQSAQKNNSLPLDSKLNGRNDAGALMSSLKGTSEKMENSDLAKALRGTSDTRGGMASEPRSVSGPSCAHADLGGNRDDTLHSTRRSGSGDVRDTATGIRSSADELRGGGIRGADLRSAGADGIHLGSANVAHGMTDGSRSDRADGAYGSRSCGIGEGVRGTLPGSKPESIRELIERVIGRAGEFGWKDARGVDTAHSIGLDGRGDKYSAGGAQGNWTAQLIPSDWLVLVGKRTLTGRIADASIQAACDNKRLDLVLALQMSDPIQRKNAISILAGIRNGNLFLDPKSKEAQSADALKRLLKADGLEQVARILATTRGTTPPRFDKHFNFETQRIIQHHLDVLLAFVNKKTESSKQRRNDVIAERNFYTEKFLGLLNRKHLTHLVDGIRDFQLTRLQSKQLANEVRKFNSKADLEPTNTAAVKVRDLCSVIWKSLVETTRMTIKNASNASGQALTENEVVRHNKANAHSRTPDSVGNGHSAERKTLIGRTNDRNNQEVVASVAHREATRTVVAHTIPTSRTDSLSPYKIDLPVRGSDSHQCNRRLIAAEATQGSPANLPVQPVADLPLDPTSGDRGAPRVRKPYHDTSEDQFSAFSSFPTQFTVQMAEASPKKAEPNEPVIWTSSLAPQQRLAKDEADLSHAQLSEPQDQSKTSERTQRRLYVTESGESLQSIAKKMLESEHLADLLLAVNRNELPDQTTQTTPLLPLSRVWLPSVREIQKHLASLPGSRVDAVSAEDELSARFGRNWGWTKVSSLENRTVVPTEQPAAIAELKILKSTAEVATLRCDVRIIKDGDGRKFNLEVLDSGTWVSVVSYDFDGDRIVRTAPWSHGLRVLRIDLPVSTARELAETDAHRNWQRYYTEYAFEKARRA